MKRVAARHRPVRPLRHARRAEELTAARQRLRSAARRPAASMPVGGRRAPPRTRRPPRWPTASIACSSASAARTASRPSARASRARPAAMSSTGTESAHCPSTSRSCPWAIRSSTVAPGRADCRSVFRCSMPRQLRRETMPGKAPGEILAHGRLAQEVERPPPRTARAAAAPASPALSGCAPPADVGGPVRPEDEQRARRRAGAPASPGGRSVAESLQCRSSSTRTSGASRLSASSASTSSRSIRSRVAPCARRCTASRSVVGQQRRQLRQPASARTA